MIFFLDATRELAFSCGGADVLRIIKFVFRLLDLVLYIIPIALIVLLMIDFGKNVMAGKEDEMKKNLNIAIKRIIYCVVLFFVPTIVYFAIDLVSEAYVPDENSNKENIVGKAAACVDLAKNSTTEELSQWEVDYENLGGNNNSQSPSLAEFCEKYPNAPRCEWLKEENKLE